MKKLHLTRGMYFPITDNELKFLKSTAMGPQRLELIREWEEEKQVFSTDKAWKMLFYILREDMYDKKKIRSNQDDEFIFYWLTEYLNIGKELFYSKPLFLPNYYIISFIHNQKLPIIHLFLTNINKKKFQECFKKVEYWLKDYGFECNDELYNYVCHWLDKILECISIARNNNKHLVFTAENC